MDNEELKGALKNYLAQPIAQENAAKDFGSSKFGGKVRWSAWALEILLTNRRAGVFLLLGLIAIGLMSLIPGEPYQTFSLLGIAGMFSLLAIE